MKNSKNKFKLNYDNNFKNKSATNFDLHLNFNSGNNLENNTNTIKKTSLLNKDYLEQLAGKPDSIDTLTQKLIYKNKSEEVNNTLQFLNDLCIKHGSTYKGRIDACKRLLNINQKVHLLICELTLETVNGLTPAELGMYLSSPS